MRLIIPIFLFILFPQYVTAQINKGGVPVIENINTLNTPGGEQNWCSVKDNRGVMYFGTQDRGVIEYDGHFWNRIQLPDDPRVYDLAVDADGTVYIGAAFEFGYLSPDENGKMEYISLVERIDSTIAREIGAVYSILVDSNRVIFSTARYLFVYNNKEDRIDVIDHSEKHYNVLLVRKVWDRIFAGDNLEGMAVLAGDSIVATPGGSYFSRKPVMCILQGSEEGELIIGTFYDGLVSYNYITGVVNEGFVDKRINEVLIRSNIYNGISLSDSTFAVGTVSGGGLFIFNKSGELLEQFDSDNSELLDNQVLSMYFDTDSSYPILWITNFGYISKAYLGLPFKVVNLEPIMNSPATDLASYKNDLYVSTDVGVLKSYIDDGDYLRFEPLEDISFQTFPIINFRNRNTDILIFGTINGLYSYNGTSTVPFGNSQNVRSLLQSPANPDILYVGLERGGVDIYKYDNGKWQFVNKIFRKEGVVITGNVPGLEEDRDGKVWIITDDPVGLYQLDFNASDTTLKKMGDEEGLGGYVIIFVKRYGDDIIVGTESGLLRYDYQGGRFVVEDRFEVPELQGDIGYDDFYVDPDGDIWFSLFSSRNFICYFPSDKGAQGAVTTPFYMLQNTGTGDMQEYKGGIWIVKSKKIYVVDKKMLEQYSADYETLIRRVVINGQSVLFDGSYFSTLENGRRIPSLVQPDELVPEIRYADNDISFFFSSPFYLHEDSIRYSYLLQPFDREWSKWDNVNYRDYTNLPHGRYTFRVRSKNMLGNYGNEAIYRFVILRPWYLSLVAVLMYVILVVLLIYTIIKIYTRRLINENVRLEGIVQERTREVVRQKEELESSIHYASRIQRAILPSQKLLQERVAEYFILFKPRDIVSGDFYWVAEKDGRLYICAADCTGHGVPGAFMSILGISFLDEIVNKSAMKYPDEILNSLRLHVTESLKQMGENDEETKDGMDLGLLVIDFESSMVEFSGAYNPCWTVRAMTPSEKKRFGSAEPDSDKPDMTYENFMLETIEADRMPIGISSRMKQAFTLNRRSLQKGASYYLFSDGYSDQFGGESGRKFLKKNLKKLILEIQGESLKKQGDILEKRLAEWMGDHPQVDDILIIGLRII